MTDIYPSQELLDAENAALDRFRAIHARAEAELAPVEAEWEAAGEPDWDENWDLFYRYNQAIAWETHTARQLSDKTLAVITLQSTRDRPTQAR